MATNTTHINDHRKTTSSKKQRMSLNFPSGGQPNGSFLTGGHYEHYYYYYHHYHYHCTFVGSIVSNTSVWSPAVLHQAKLPPTGNVKFDGLHCDHRTRSHDLCTVKNNWWTYFIADTLYGNLWRWALFFKSTKAI